MLGVRQTAVPLQTYEEYLLPAKIVVTESKGGSRISLLGASGKELLGSTVFSEPRAKGATLRALRGLLGEVVVEDHTLAAKAKPVATKAAETPRTRKAAASRPATKAKAGTPATKSATTRRRSAPKAVAAAQAAPVATAPAETKTKRGGQAAPAKARRTRAAKA